MRILEAAAAHFQRDFKGLRDVTLYLRKQVRAPTELVKSLERLSSAHGFVKHTTDCSCDCVLAQLHLLPPAPCAPDAERSCGQEETAQVIQPTVSEASQVPIDVHLGVHFEQQEALSGGVGDARVPTCSLAPSSEVQPRVHLPMHSRIFACLLTPVCGAFLSHPRVRISCMPVMEA